MFDQVDLVTIKTVRNKNGEKIEEETRTPVPIVKQTVKQEMRDAYNQRGLGRAMRFKVQLFGDSYNEINTPYFIYKGIRYSVTDFVPDVTGTSYYIEGTTTRGKL